MGGGWLNYYPWITRLKRRGIEWTAVWIDVGIALRNADHINPDHYTLMAQGSFHKGRKGFKTNGILEKQGCTKKLYKVKQIQIAGGGGGGKS